MMKQDTKNANTLVTVSIVSHGDAKKTKSALESIQIHEQSHKIQIIVTDNLGNDLPELDPSPWASLIILRNQKIMGFAHNHNQAFKLATGKYFCVLNPDILFVEHIFPLLIKRLEREAAIISPLIIDSSNTIQDSFREFPTPLSILKRRLPGYHFTALPPDDLGIIHPDWIAGMFMFMRSETYCQLGGFDEKYHLYFEDVDFCLRARSLDLPVPGRVLPLVDTNLHIQHNAQRASRKNLRYLLWHLQSAIRFFTSKVYKDTKKKRN
jgi:N-acetylglucosaminyl-diphospho-decaprenol L-rhamnosyltransferase